MSSLVQARDSAWRTLEAAIVSFDGDPIGTVAARDDSTDPLNYDHVFVRDFAVSAFAFLARGRGEIVRNFLIRCAELQQTERTMRCFRPGRGLMPASFTVEQDAAGNDEIQPDFGEHAIGRVTPVDSGLWWLVILRAYVRATGDDLLDNHQVVARAARLVLDSFLAEPLEMMPTVLVPDGAYMIDRRMGVYGHPVDVQVLFAVALRSARDLIDDAPLRDAIDHRLRLLCDHLRRHYWLDLDRLNEINRFEVNEFGESVENPFNIYPESIPSWLAPWMPEPGGYFAGNVGPGRIDFRWFAQGNLLAVLGSIATPGQSDGIIRLLEARWDDLVAAMPLKLCYPAIWGRDWQLLTGSDQKNVAWSYHNAGSWPSLLWLLTAAASRAGRADLAQRAVEIAAGHLEHDDWPEYYDGPQGRLVGRRARLKQTWSAAGFAAAAEMLERPDAILPWLAFDEPVADDRA